MLEIPAVFLGVLAGFFTGVLPSFHINNVAFFIGLLSFSSELRSVGVFLVSMSIAHNFFDFIPAIVFGAGEESSVSSFIGSRMFMNGEGLKALKLASIGCLMGACCSLFLIPVLGVVLPYLYVLFDSYSWILLLGVELMLLFRDSKFSALAVFAFSGILGVLTLNSSLSFPLLSLFSGLFGLGILWDNFGRNVKSQMNIYGIPADRKTVVKSGFIGVFSSIILGLVPAIGPTQASVVTYTDDDDESFLIRMGSVNVSDIFISLLSLFMIGKARSGVLVVLSDILTITVDDLILFFSAGFMSAVISFFVCIKFGVHIFNFVEKLNYTHLVLFAVLFIFGMNILFNGFAGIIVCILGALISRFAIKSKVMKSHAMGCLMIPTIIFYFSKLI